MSVGSTEIGYLCHHGHYCFYADPDEGGQCGSKRVGTVTLTFDDSDAPNDWTEIVADAQASLAEKYETWRKCDCEGSAAYVKEADDLVVSIERRAACAEAKVARVEAFLSAMEKLGSKTVPIDGLRRNLRSPITVEISPNAMSGNA